MGRRLEFRKEVRFCGHMYDKEWLRNYLSQHTAQEVLNELPNVKTVANVYQKATQLGVSLVKMTEHDFAPSKTLCWQCANATDGNKCSWVRDNTPVDGWEAEKTEIQYGYNITKSYSIKKCPLFKEGRK